MAQRFCVHNQPSFNVTCMFVGLATLAVLGCRDRTADFTPSPSIAESALRRTLEAWQAGHTGGEIAGSKPLIHVTDAERKPSQSLTNFKILGQTQMRSGRTYAVELALENPKETIKTEYVIVGIDPLWVFRREDYELLMHWDHRMPELPVESDQTSGRE